MLILLHDKPLFLYNNPPVYVSLAFEASTDPIDTSAQAALAPHQTTEQEESADTT
jgi:hypothetical protein